MPVPQIWCRAASSTGHAPLCADCVSLAESRSSQRPLRSNVAPCERLPSHLLPSLPPAGTEVSCLPCSGSAPGVCPTPTRAPPPRRRRRPGQLVRYVSRRRRRRPVADRRNCRRRRRSSHVSVVVCRCRPAGVELPDCCTFRTRSINVCCQAGRESLFRFE